MSYLIPDTIVATTTPFDVQGIQDSLSRISWIEFQNEGAYSLAVQAGASGFQIPAWMGWPLRLADCPGFALPISITPKAILNYQASAPGQTLSVIIYLQGETPAHTQPYTLARQTNVGNTLPVSTQSDQVINTGNTAPTAVLSGTPSGASSPEALINNDGSAILGGGHVAMNSAGQFTALPAGAVPAASIGAGALPAGVTVAAGQVGSGYPAADLSGAINAAQVNPGTFPTGEFDFKAADAIGTAAMILWSGNVVGGYGHILYLKNGADNTCLSILGIGDFTQSPFGFGTWLFDQKNNGTVFTGVSAERTVAKRGPLAQMTTNGGGACGNRVWQGTTDPGANAGEGDLWAPA